MSAQAYAVDLELIEDIARFANDPLGYVLYVFPWGVPGTELANKTGPRTWQAEVLAEIRDELQRQEDADIWEVVREAVASGHGIGKSALVSWIVKWAVDTREDTRGVVTANTDTQLRTKTWPELGKWHNLSLTRGWFTHTATALISTAPGHDKTWRVDAIPWSEHNTEAFAGLHNEGKRILLVFDEASGIAARVWEVAEGALTDAETEIIWLVCGNPTRADGRFHACFNGLRHRWKHRNIDSRTVEGTNKAQLEAWVNDYGEDSDFVRVRVRGQFPRSNSNQFISSEDVTVAQKRQKPDKATIAHAARVVGVDVARHGDDESVIIKRQGPLCEAPKRMRIPDTMALAAEVIEVIRQWRPDAVFVDATGMGWGVIDRLRQVGYGNIVYAVQTGERAVDESRYRNHRAELFGRMRDWIKEAGVVPDDPQLVIDITGPEYFFDNFNRLVLEKKEDMKARGLASPDSADALALTFHTAVAPRTKNDEPDWKRQLRARARGGSSRSPMTA